MSRKPKPTKLKILQGTDRADRRNPGEPEINPEIPPMPGHLSDEARAEWERMAKPLFDLGLLTPVDMASFAAYCQAYGRWAQAETKLKTEGLTVTTTNGNHIQNPLVGIANQAMEHMRKHLANFGMSPADRAKVVANKIDGSSDPFDKLF
jgi:P27 family predicted phage terminase small subunit